MRFITRHTLPWIGGLLLLGSACGPGYRGVEIRADIGPGLDLYSYSSEHYGDWRTNYQQWTPVMVYEIDGRYYPSQGRGRRQVQVYRSQSGYFLPPRDREWQQKERRFKGNRRPNDGDYGRARTRPRP